MADIEAAAGAGFCVPPGTDTTAGAGSIKAHACNHQEYMAALCIDGEPFAEPGMSPFQEITGGREGSFLEHARLAQHKGCGAGAIVGRVHVLAVASAETIGFAYNLVARGNGAFDAGRGFVGNRDFAVFQLFGGAFYTIIS